MQYGIIFVSKKTHERQKLGHEKVLEEICEELGALGPDTKSSLTKTKPRASAKQPAKWF